MKLVFGLMAALVFATAMSACGKGNGSDPGSDSQPDASPFVSAISDDCSQDTYVAGPILGGSTQVAGNVWSQSMQAGADAGSSDTEIGMSSNRTDQGTGSTRDTQCSALSRVFTATPESADLTAGMSASIMLDLDLTASSFPASLDAAKTVEAVDAQVTAARVEITYWKRSSTCIGCFESVGDPQKLPAEVQCSASIRAARTVDAKTLVDDASSSYDFRQVYFGKLPPTCEFRVKSATVRTSSGTAYKVSFAGRIENTDTKTKLHVTRIHFE